ncbi:unnamed protein product [Allacma fusca]|uniref:Uncharacterized protein n=1 Tax=Allacma fusca TaxID=39272 RepID=A0A8J2JVV4_9HEXA|nr:unnamed protein product [Allacma fusca]
MSRQLLFAVLFVNGNGTSSSKFTTRKQQIRRVECSRHESKQKVCLRAEEKERRVDAEPVRQNDIMERRAQEDDLVRKHCEVQRIETERKTETSGEHCRLKQLEPKRQLELQIKLQITEQLYRDNLKRERLQNKSLEKQSY